MEKIETQKNPTLKWKHDRDREGGQGGRKVSNFVQSSICGKSSGCLGDAQCGWICCAHPSLLHSWFLKPTIWLPLPALLKPQVMTEVLGLPHQLERQLGHRLSLVSPGPSGLSSPFLDSSHPTPAWEGGGPPYCAYPLQLLWPPELDPGGCPACVRPTTCGLHLLSVIFHL